MSDPDIWRTEPSLSGTIAWIRHQRHRSWGRKGV